MRSFVSRARLGARATLVAAVLLSAAACGSSAASPEQPTSTPLPDGAAAPLVVDAEEATARLRVRLQPAEFVAAVEDLAALEVADGLYATLVLDYPESSQPVTTDQLIAWDLELDPAVELALDNVAWDGAPIHDSAAVGGGTVEVYGERIYAASWVLLLDDLLDAAAPSGVVVAIPTRENLDVHVVSADSRPVLDVMAEVAYQTYEDGPASITDDLYWWHDGELTTIPTIDGRVRSLPSELDGVLD